MTEKSFQNFENSPSLEFFCEFFWQTLNFYCQSSYGQIFFKLCIHTLKNTYFHMNQEKKYTFSPKAKCWPWKRPFFCITILLSKKLHESKIWPHFYFSNFLSLWSESVLIFSKFWVFQHETERASRRRKKEYRAPHAASITSGNCVRRLARSISSWKTQNFEKIRPLSLHKLKKLEK